MEYLILISTLIFLLVIFNSINPINIKNSVYDAKFKVELSYAYQDNEIKIYILFENNRHESIIEMTNDIFQEFIYTKLGFSFTTYTNYY